MSNCETSLNDEAELQNVMLENSSSFVSANSRSNTRRGGVGLFYENALPI